MKRMFAVVFLATTTVLAPVAVAQRMKDMAMNAASTPSTHVATGTVKKADASRGTVTFAHGPVASMKWPAMTMEFEVADKSMLDKLKPGANVEFQFREKSKGKYVVTEVRP